MKEVQKSLLGLGDRLGGISTLEARYLVFTWVLLNTNRSAQNAKIYSDYHVTNIGNIPVTLQALSAQNENGPENIRGHF
jgi:hypothetical protein